MKPGNHEYKVMGLAPYASNYEINKCYKIFDKILKIKGLNIIFDKKPKDLFFHFKENLKIVDLMELQVLYKDFLKKSYLIGLKLATKD